MVILNIGIYILILSIILILFEIYQYFKGRDVNVKYINDSMKFLENKFRPVSKEYDIIGPYIGFRARYVRDEEPRDVLISFLTLPRCSLLYYLVSKIFGKGDRVMMILGYSKDVNRGEVHVCDVKFSMKILEDSDKNFNREVLDNGKVLLYDDYETSRIFYQIFNNCRLPIRHVAYDPNSRCIYLYSHFSNIEEFYRIVDIVFELAKRLA